MNSHRELDFTCSIHHFKPFMDKKINNLLSFVINFLSLSFYQSIIL